MKTKNMREMEKHWAEKAKKAAKPATVGHKKKNHEVSQSAVKDAKEAPKED